MKTIISIVITICALFVAVPATASDGSAQGVAADVPLKIQIVLSRYQGEKKISSIPYTMTVIAPSGGKSETTKLRLGIDVPVPQAVFNQGSATPTTSYNYRNVGTSIDCTARALDGGVYRLDVILSDSAVFMPDQGIKSGVSGVPTLRTYTSNFNVLVKDGQTAQQTAATDPVSGEVLRVDVTLTVLK